MPADQRPAGATESPVTYDISSIAAKSPQLLRHTDSHKRAAGGAPASTAAPRILATISAAVRGLAAPGLTRLPGFSKIRDQ